jgi:hypothetical protein
MLKKKQFSINLDLCRPFHQCYINLLPPYEISRNFNFKTSIVLDLIYKMSMRQNKLKEGKELNKNY